jgi:hypothetical protein
MRNKHDRTMDKQDEHRRVLFVLSLLFSSKHNLSSKAECAKQARVRASAPASSRLCGTRCGWHVYGSLLSHTDMPAARLVRCALRGRGC